MKNLLFSMMVLGAVLVQAAPLFAQQVSTHDANRTYCGGEPAQIKFAPINVSSSGNNTLVAAVAGKQIRVMSYTIIPAADVVVRFESGANGDALTGQMPLLEEDGLVTSIINLNCAPYGCFQTDAGDLLNLELGSAVGVDGHLTYVECE